MTRKQFMASLLSMPVVEKVAVALSPTMTGTRVAVNGEDIEDVRAVTIRHKAGELPTVVLDFVDLETMQRLGCYDILTTQVAMMVKSLSVTLTGAGPVNFDAWVEKPKVNESWRANKPFTTIGRIKSIEFQPSGNLEWQPIDRLDQISGPVVDNGTITIGNTTTNTVRTDGRRR